MIRNLNQFFFAAEIKHLKIYLTVIFVLVLILLLLFLLMNGSKIFKYFRRSFATLKKNSLPKKDKPAEPVTMANPHTLSPKMRQKVQPLNHNNLNRTSSIFTVSGTEYEAKTVSTPVSTRYPAEDTLTSSATVTADYSYDNRALQLTPVCEERPKIETTF
jgi:anionic cell wall polymer biosynthesis LytR-Cps2A-Psr (LCP) family protein